MMGSKNHRFPALAWRASMRVMGWLPLSLLLLLLMLVLPFDDAGGFVKTFPFLADSHLLETVIPLAMGIQAAWLLSPADEAPLEILLVTKRPLAWVVVERLAVMLVLQGNVALLTTIGLSAYGTLPGPEWVNVARWLAPGLLFAGIGVFVTLSTRQGLYGLGVVVLAFLGLQMTGPYLLARWPDAWPVAPFLDAGSFTSGEYLFNRVLVIGIGVALTGWGLRTLRNTEDLFERQKSRKDRGSGLPSFSLFPSTPLFGVIRYEALLIWRARMIPLIFATITGIFLVAAAYNRIWNMDEFTSMVENLPSETVREQITMMAANTLTALSMLVVMLLPIFMSDARPKDRQFGVTELLESFPIPERTLLAGKLLGGWGWVVAGLVAMFGLGIVWERVLFGPLALNTLGELFFLTTLPLGLYTSGMGILLASGQPNRRRATIAGMAFIAYLLLLSFTTTGGMRDSLLADPLVFMLYNLNIPGFVLYTRADLWRAIGAMAVQLVLVWGVMGLWRKMGVR